MRTQLYSTSTLVALAAAAATLSLVACEKSQPPTSAPVAQAASTEKAFIEFRGPWAFAPDPKDANSVLAIAPKAKGHRDLYVQASNQLTLAAGVYDLSLPAHSGTAAATADPSIAQAKLTPNICNARSIASPRGTSSAFPNLRSTWLPAGSEAGWALAIRPMPRRKRTMPQPCRCATTSAA